MIFFICTLAQFFAPSLVGASYAEFSPHFYESHHNFEIEKIKKKYQKLYEDLIPEDLRIKFPQQTERSFKAHIKDSQKFFPETSLITESYLSPQLPYLAQGKITYVNVYPARYNYDLYFDSKNNLTIEVRIHFRNKDSQLIKSMVPKIKQAQALWNQHRIKLDFNYNFLFKLVSDKKQAHLSVKLLNKPTRGPYFSRWSTTWRAFTVAHEFGHILGLGDEYRTLSGKMDCLETSLMCTSYKGVPMYHHYYHILRRSLQGWKI